MEQEKVTYTAAMAEIEKILARLRDEKVDVDTLAQEVKHASELIALCKERLHTAEDEVKKVLEQE